MKKRKVPVVWTPSRNCTSTLAPLASGAFSVMKPTESDESRPPPLVCAGGVSSVVPLAVTTQGADKLAAVHVVGSLIATTVSPTVLARRSARLPDGGKVVMLMMRNRSLVTGWPVLFTTLRRIVIVPKVELFGGPAVRARSRFG